MGNCAEPPTRPPPAFTDVTSADGLAPTSAAGVAKNDKEGLVCSMCDSTVQLPPGARLAICRDGCTGAVGRPFRPYESASKWPAWAVGDSSSSRYAGQTVAAKTLIRGHTSKAGRPSPRSTDKVKALLIACDYVGTPFEAPGCVEAVERMRELLEEEYGLQKGGIRTLLDEGATVINILNGLSWLAAGARPGDALVFHFCGHGSQQRAPPEPNDPDAPYGSGFDDSIVPHDFLVAGQISDTVLFDHLVAVLPSGVQLTAIFDCCQHPVSLDLPFRWPSGQQGSRRISEPAVAHHHIGNKQGSANEVSPKKYAVLDLTVASQGPALSQAGALWEARKNAYFCAADVQSFSFCERRQDPLGDRRQLLTEALLGVLRRAPDATFTKVMRQLFSPEVTTSLSEPPTLRSSQPFDNAVKRFSLNGSNIVANMNEVLGRERDKPAGGLVLSACHPLCPSAQWNGQYTTRPQRAVALPKMPPLESYQDKEGTVYDGEWFDAPQGPRTGHGGALDRSGQLYVGQWLENEQSGRGEQVWPDGTRYEGSYERGLKHGQGRIWWPNGAEYLGDLYEDKLWGEGGYRWPDGRKFRGQWVDNKMEGRGTYTWKTGPHSMYFGQYKEGKKHGEGTLNFSDGRRVTGIWMDGLLYESPLKF